MPTYDYICKKCGHEFEEFHSISEEPIRICPKCGHMSVERKISGGSGLIFKGSGFYITDYSGNKSAASSSSNSDNGNSKSQKDTKPGKKAKTAETKNTPGNSD